MRFGDAVPHRGGSEFPAAAAVGNPGTGSEGGAAAAAPAPAASGFGQTFDVPGVMVAAAFVVTLAVKLTLALFAVPADT